MKIIKKESLTSCFSHVTISATFEELKQVLGEPSYRRRSTSEKSQYEWELYLEDGTPFFIYDWKEFRIFHTNEKISWHVGCAPNSGAINRVMNALAETKLKIHRLGL